ncbi:MAG TPA: glycosyltransferase, partial [Paracoccaceae bacterium]|nr:glycosyltransferase [Paracoccaceae bacterium]
MIVVTHLLGTGHLARALTLAEAFLRMGHHPQVVSGGFPAPHLATGAVEVTQLPPLRSDGTDFTHLIGSDGPADTAYHTQRRVRMIAAFDSFKPDVLMTELFPFGRRGLRREFTDLLSHARGAADAPLICASIRDILAPPSKPSKAEFADRMLRDFYDAVLVHADPALTPLDLSWPISDTLGARLHYTGFVAPAPAAPDRQGLGKGEIIVSTGGGDVGHYIHDAALGAARRDPRRRWRLLIGGANAAHLARLQADAPQNATVEAARPEFRAMLHHATASVSQCGYNTALDILQAGTRAVFVPFDEDGEVEQGLRAKALSAHPGIATLPRDRLSPESLLAALDEVARDARMPARALFDGAARTVE